MLRQLHTNDGFTLVEIVIVIVVLGVLATIATLKMTPAIETARIEQTKQEMDQLAHAIVGNPELYTHGARTDFGYVGDVGALPPNLDALVQNPGGYGTWHGPYIETGPNGDDFKKDGWGVSYVYTGLEIRSTGSGSNIDKPVAASSTLLLNNTLKGVVCDANLTQPGTTYRDSLIIQVTYPNGSGGTTTAAVYPDQYGYFSLSGIPVGNHYLKVIYRPDTDTLTFPLTVYPGREARADIVFPADLW